MGADEEEDDFGGSEVFEDVLLPFGSWDEIAVIPVANDVLVSQIAQVDGQFIAEFAIPDMGRRMPVTLPCSEGSGSRAARSFAALRMTTRTPLKSTHRKALSPNV